VQADLCRLPFDAARSIDYLLWGFASFDAPAAVGEIARVAKPSAPVMVYLYEDFIARARCCAGPCARPTPCER
jgi:hypothetical protein